MLEASYPSVRSGERQETLLQASCKVSPDPTVVLCPPHICYTHLKSMHIPTYHTRRGSRTDMISVGKMGFGTSIPKKSLLVLESDKLESHSVTSCLRDLGLPLP